MQQIIIHQHCGSQTHDHDPTVTKQCSQPHNLFMENWVPCPSIVSQGLHGLAIKYCVYLISLTCSRGSFPLLIYNGLFDKL